MYATTLDLNMGYYTIHLDPTAQEICTIVTPWGKYTYMRLPMGLSCVPDIFQSEMSSLMEGMEFVRTYLDDLLVLTCGTIEDHLDKLTQVFKQLNDSGLWVQIKKCKFCAPEVEYLGYHISRNSIGPQPRKIEAILNLGVPKPVCDVRRILVVVQYYGDMWPRRSHMLAPLTDLISTQGITSTKENNNKVRKIVWSAAFQKAFDDMKRLVSREVLLGYPRFDQPFKVYTDASTY